LFLRNLYDINKTNSKGDLMSNNIDIIKDAIKKYLKYIDESITELSKKKERELIGLPSWILADREIAIAKIIDTEFYVFKIVENNELDDNKFIYTEISENEISEFTNIGFPKLPNGDYLCIMIGECIHVSKKESRYITKGLHGVIKIDELENTFGIDSASKQAIQIWNNIVYNFPVETDFEFKLKEVIKKCELLIKRKSFFERRIHRYINEYSKFILPDHKECYFEHKIHSENSYRKADFVLERESGLPSLLIELENPCHKIFTKKGDFTKEVNHAKVQISEWIKLIDKHSINTKNKMSFLQGNKQRMVIIGRGLERIKEMRDTNFDDTTIWSYNLLILEAKNKWNNYYREIQDLIGAKVKKIFTV
jgi:uncharacterized protein YaaR (DUF327 family)